MRSSSTRLVLAALVLAAACGGDEHVPADASAPADAPAAPDAGVDAPPPPPPAAVHLQLLAFNDFHGNLEPPAGSSGTVITERPEGMPPVTVPAGGAAFFATHVAQLRAAEPNTLVVSAGDLIGASPLTSALFHDEPTIEAMNEIGLDVSAVGNHEFDEGGAELLRMQYGGCHPVDGCQDGTGFAGARFSFLAANVEVDESGGRTLLPSYVVREVDGVPVAFIGMTLEATPTIVSPVGVGGLSFHDEAATVNQLVPVLRAAGVRAIVVLVHEGGLQTGLYDQCVGISGAIVDLVGALDDEVDLVVSGHTHAAYNCVIDGTPVTSALSFGRLVTKIDLTLDPVSHDVTAVEAANRIVTRDVSPDPAVGALVTRYLDRVAPLRDRVIGQVATALTGPRSVPTPTGESLLGDVIADAMLAATAADNRGHAVVAFMNPGGVRADLDAGDVTYGEAFTIQPFGNTLVTLTLTGAQVDAMLEQQWMGAFPRILQPSAGFSYTWSMAAPVGQRVDAASIRIGGAPVAADATYRVTVNNFLATGGDGFTVLNDGTQRLGGPVDVDALEAYLTAHSPVAAPALERIRVVP